MTIDDIVCIAFRELSTEYPNLTKLTEFRDLRLIQSPDYRQYIAVSNGKSFAVRLSVFRILRDFKIDSVGAINLTKRRLREKFENLKLL
jgi:hypothetical protein